MTNAKATRQIDSFVALDHARLQLCGVVRAPSLGAVRDAVAGRASIGHRYSVGKVKGTKLAEVLAKAQTLFA